MTVDLTTVLREAARRLRRSPVFSAAAISTIAVGIGINAAMVAGVDALLLRPPPDVADARRVVRVLFRIEDAGRASVVNHTHYPNVVELMASGAFSKVAAYEEQIASIDKGVSASSAHVLLVSNDFFDVLGTRPRVGTLLVDDDRAVISYGFWRGHFAGDPRVIGTRLLVDRKVYSVAGVVPPGFQPLTAQPVDVWLPLDHAVAAGSAPRDWRHNTGPFWLAVVARLAAGVSPSAAQTRATSVLERRGDALREGPRVEVVTTSLVPGRGADVSLESRVVVWLAGVSMCVLLMACANVSTLVLTRGFQLRREHFVRLALGASRGALLRASLIETSMIVIPGAVGALALSFLLRNVLSQFLSGDIPLATGLFEPRTTSFVLASSALAFLLVALTSLVRQRSWIACRSGTWYRPNERYPSKGLGPGLLALQAGLCLLLLYIAGLFATSLARVDALDLGVDLDRTIQITINVPPAHRTAADVGRTYERARDALTREPDVERVSLAVGSPYASGSGAGPWTAERGFADLWSHREVAYQSVVGAGFFSTVGSHSLRGRDFNDRDRADAQPVVIINTPLARWLWPSKAALGECLWLDSAKPCLRVVGVLGGVWKFDPLEREQMAIYLPLAQVPGAEPSALFIRARGDARTALARARSIVQVSGTDLPAARAILLRDAIDVRFKSWRLGARIFSAFAAVALLIGATGLYAMAAMSVTIRLKEIGIRMAIGARTSHIILIVVRGVLASQAVGFGAGALVAVGMSRRLGGILFETSPHDFGVLIGTAGILCAVSVIAMIVPTIRALHTHPARVLRSD